MQTNNRLENSSRKNICKNITFFWDRTSLKFTIKDKMTVLGIQMEESLFSRMKIQMETFVKD